MKAEKLELVRMLIETKDKNIIDRVKAVFEGRPKANPSEEWNDEVKKDLEEAIRQADAGELIPHDKAVTLLKKWG